MSLPPPLPQFCLARLKLALFSDKLFRHKPTLLRFLMVLSVLLLFTKPSFSQSELGSWNVLSVKSSLNSKWGLFAETQLRSLKFYTDFHYYEVKAGASYTISKNVQFSIATGHYNTYQAGGDFVKPKRSDEIRLWQQLAFKQAFENLTVEHRYRAEQRWNQKNWRQRFRYRLNVVVPVNRNKIEVGTLYGLAWNEIFLTNRAPYFERNRVFAGLGYQLNNQLTLQGGYIYQFDYFLVDEIGRQFLQLSVMLDLNFRKQNGILLPASND
jgi:hypothetical protein